MNPRVVPREVTETETREFLRAPGCGAPRLAGAVQDGPDVAMVQGDAAVRRVHLPPGQAGDWALAGSRSYQKAGFVEEGRYRESVLHDGRWYDAVLMSILDHEWAARRSPSR
jgi:hypothetical protein